MITLNLRDKNFSSHAYSSLGASAGPIKWDRLCRQNGPIVYTDLHLHDSLKSLAGEKIAWLLEPPGINSRIYNWVKNNHAMFSEVWTTDSSLLNSIPNGIWIPIGGTWINECDRVISSKSQLCSFIASAKKSTAGHKLRQEVRAALPDTIIKFGKGFHFVPNKAECLKPYCFSIVIENSISDIYFTEKIIDCFNTGTIPIYWGTPRISDYFNKDGIIQFYTITELQEILRSLSFEKYNSLAPALADNFQRAKEFEAAELWISKFSKFAR